MFNTAANEVMYLSIVTRITSKKIRVISTGVETIGTLRSDDEDDYEHEFSVLRRALRKMSASEPYTNAQYGKLVLVVVLVV